MTFLGFFLAGLFKDTAIAAFMMQRRRRQQEDQNLRQWTQHSKVRLQPPFLTKLSLGKRSRP